MHYLALLLLALSHCLFAANTPAIPSLLLANNFHADIRLDDYWVSEKYDGVRAYWNGRELLSRQGHIFDAPVWFTRGLPVQPLDGELWLERGTFDQLSGIVRSTGKNNPEWKKLRYMVFDAPAHPGIFTERIAYIKNLLDTAASPYAVPVPQWRVASLQQLHEQLDTIHTQGGEGLMLHRGDSRYRCERSDDLLKLKLFDDAEAVVLRHIPGKGKYTHMMGSIEVVDAEGRHFRIGSGFSDAERKQPPAIGTTITYRFNGTTRHGLPRFPRFLRIRNDW